MRGTSLNFSTNESQQPKRNRGGEKKVMKKSLSMALATAMVVSMFSSVSFAADNSLDAQAKFDALKEAGVFDGYADGSAGLDKEMTRAEYAAVLVRMLGLTPDSSTSSYNDVANHWAQEQGYVQAVTKAGIMEGPADGQFDPDGKVTVEQLATIMVRALNLQVEADATVEGEVSDWATGYVAAAVEAGLIPNSNDFTVPAKRDQLVSSTYIANEIKPSVNGKIGIAELKATGASKLTVKFNGAVNADKVELEVKRNGVAVDGEFTVADDKRSADIELESKIVEGEYSVVLSGVDNLDSEKATATVKTENEKVSKIDFVTASDVLPRAEKTRVEFKVMNQYGEDAKIPASQLEIKSNEERYMTQVAGESAVEFNLAAREGNVSTGRRVFDFGDRISVTITHDDSRVTVNKIFSVGDDQRVSKVEIGKLMNSAGKEITAVEKGDDAYLQVFAYDQYGLKVIDEQALEDDINFSARDMDEAPSGEVFDLDVDNDKLPDLKFTVDDRADIGEQTVYLYSAGGSASKVIKIVAESEPATIEFGVTSLNLAEGDGLSDDSTSALYAKFIPLIVKNSAGEELTKDEIASAFDQGKIEVRDRSSAFRTDGIETTGAFKGQIKLYDFRKGSGTLEVSLDDFPNERATMNLYVGDERKVEEIRLGTNIGETGVVLNGLSGEARFDFRTFDQYGDQARDGRYNEDYVVRLTLTSTGPDVAETGALDYHTPTGDVQISTTLDNFVDGVKRSLRGAGVIANSAENEIYVTLKDLYDKDIKIVRGVPGKTYKVKAELFKKSSTGAWDEDTMQLIDDVTKTYEMMKQSDINTKALTFSAGAANAVMDGDRIVLKDLSRTSFINAVDVDQRELDVSNLKEAGKEIRISAKDGSKDVTIPSAIVKSVYSSNPNVARGFVGNTGGDVGKGFIFGLDEGEANLTVIFHTNKGEGTANIKVVVKDTPTNITSITPKYITRVIPTAQLTGGLIWDDNILGEFIAKEGAFGNEISKAEFATYANILGIQFVVAEQTDSFDTITVGLDGRVSITDRTSNESATANGGSFTLKVVAPNGVEQLFEIGYTPGA